MMPSSFLISWLALLIFILSLNLVAPARFYIYNWSDQVMNKYARYRSDHSYDPNFIQNGGAGPFLDEKRGFHNTWQFSLFKIVYERAVIDERRTYDPSEATTFFLPYDYGVDATFRQDNGKMRRVNCPLSDIVTEKLVHESPYFNKSGGKDHLLVISVNQNMNYFLDAPKCKKFLAGLCYNCTKVSIDEYSFLHRKRKGFLSKRGDFWHAAPFPSNIHYSTKVAMPPPWAATTSPESGNRSKSIIASYTGSRSSLNPISHNIRRSVAYLCDQYLNATRSDKLTVCTSAGYGMLHKRGNKALLASRIQNPSMHSVFCIQPPGDMPTRKSVFDTILVGCIPVFLNRLTGPLMYEWHWSEQQWSDASVIMDSLALPLHEFWDQRQKEEKVARAWNRTYEPPPLQVLKKFDIISMLQDIYDNHPNVVKAKQLVIQRNAFSLQYSLPEQQPPPETSSSAMDTEKTASSISSTLGYFLQARGGESKKKSKTKKKGERRGRGGNRAGKRRVASSMDYGLDGPDAYDIIMTKVMDIHSGVRSHARTSSYMRCAGDRTGQPDYVDFCWATNNTTEIREDVL